ncbi:MAG: hypothetical protein Q4D27_02785 [Coriobacteriia bacterium]|nr:hypothetical protein [Coriobacteriia bacterium]
MKTLTRGLIAVGLCIIVLGFCSTFLFSGTNALSNAATTVMLQNGSLTQQVESALYDNDELIAQKLGVTASEVDDFVRNLDLSNWEAVELPSDVTAAGEYEYEYEGQPVSATLYDDPEYVTVNIGGQEVTLHVSESASQFLRQLQ